MEAFVGLNCPTPRGIYTGDDAINSISIKTPIENIPTEEEFIRKAERLWAVRGKPNQTQWRAGSGTTFTDGTDYLAHEVSYGLPSFLPARLLATIELPEKNKKSEQFSGLRSVLMANLPSSKPKTSRLLTDILHYYTHYKKAYWWGGAGLQDLLRKNQINAFIRVTSTLHVEKTNKYQHLAKSKYIPIDRGKYVLALNMINNPTNCPFGWAMSGFAY